MKEPPPSIIHRGGTGRTGPAAVRGASYLSVKTNIALPAGKCSTSGHRAG
jgi:hypothetical protein